MFKTYDDYVMRQLGVSTLIVGGALSMLVLLTQSLRLIELVLSAQASTDAFLSLITLSFPRFFESVLPIACLVSSLFVFTRMTGDSEMIVLRASGLSSFRLLRPVLFIGAALSLFLLLLSLWVSPYSIARMQDLRGEIRSQYAHMLLREGIFNTIGSQVTAYVRERGRDGQLTGLMVHDTRQTPTVTIVARSGQLISTADGQKIIVYDGARQEFNPATKKYARLDFKQYTLDMPNTTDPVVDRWREPDERTVHSLLDRAAMARETPKRQGEFRSELHRRLSMPFLMVSFAVIGALSMLIVPYRRQSNPWQPILAAALTALALQSLYLFVYNLSKESALACLGLYAVSAAPLLLVLCLLTPRGELFLQRFRR